MSKRNLQVQTPGEVPVAAPEAPQTDTQALAAEAPQADANPAKKPAERQNYAGMAADDIDPYALTAPVLSRDGWVVPAKKA